MKSSLRTITLHVYLVLYTGNAGGPRNERVKVVAEWQKHIPSPIEHMFQQQQRHHHHHPPITVVVRQCGILIKTKINDLRNESLIY